MKTILKEIIKTLKKIQNCLVIVSLGSSTQYDYLFSELFLRTIHIQQDYNELSTYINDNGKKSFLPLKLDELEIISHN